MKKTSLLLFILISTAHLVAELCSSELTLISKPLLMPALAFYLYSLKGFKKDISKLYGALLFSMAGDVLLMFSKENQLFFIAGLGAFLVAHLIYVAFFLQEKEKRGTNPQAVIPLFSYYIIFMYLLWDGLDGPLLFAVPLYAFVLLMMAYTAIQYSRTLKKLSGKLLIIGALSFVLSDSLIGLNAFTSYDFSNPLGRLAIMSTYLLGQFLIIDKAVSLET